MGACRVINIKAGRVGGLSEAVAIHDLCRAQGVPVWCGGMLETGVGPRRQPGAGLAARLHAARRHLRHRPLLRSRTSRPERFTLNPDSTIDVPDGPGLGVTLDQEALERVTQAKKTIR